MSNPQSKKLIFLVVVGLAIAVFGVALKNFTTRTEPIRNAVVDPGDPH